MLEVWDGMVADSLLSVEEFQKVLTCQTENSLWDSPFSARRRNEENLTVESLGKHTHTVAKQSLYPMDREQYLAGVRGLIFSEWEYGNLHLQSLIADEWLERPLAATETTIDRKAEARRAMRLMERALVYAHKDFDKALENAAKVLQPSGTEVKSQERQQQPQQQQQQQQQQQEQKHEQKQEQKQEQTQEQKQEQKQQQQQQQQQKQQRSREDVLLQPNYQELMTAMYQPLFAKLEADDQILLKLKWQHIENPKVAKFIFWDPFYKMEDQPSGQDLKRARALLDQVSTAGTVLMVTFKLRTNAMGGPHVSQK